MQVKVIKANQRKMWGQGKVYEKAKKYYVAAEARHNDSSIMSANSADTSISSVKSSATNNSKKQAKTSNHGGRRGRKHSKEEATQQLSQVEIKAEKALNMINETIRSQEERETELQQSLDNAILDAKNKLNEGNKRAAVRYMKKAKLYRLEQDKIGGAIETMEAQVLQIESALNNAKVIEAMRTGSQTMQSLQSTDGNNMESIDEILDGIRDTHDYAQEIQDILSQPVQHVVGGDDELLKELEELTEKSIADFSSSLPIAPTNKLSQQEETNEAKPGMWGVFK